MTNDEDGVLLEQEERMDKIQADILEYLNRSWPLGSGQTLGRIARHLGSNTYSGRKATLAALRALKKSDHIEYHGFNKVWYIPISPEAQARAGREERK